MKKLFGLFMIGATISISACAQKLEASKVPTAVKSGFEKAFPGSTAKWEKEKANYEANFKHNGEEMSALFSADGTMQESEMEIKESQLPAAATEYLKKNYPGQKIKETAKIMKADGSVNYEAEVKGMDIIFDGAGKFLKTAKD